MNYYLIVVACMLGNTLFGAEVYTMTQLAPKGIPVEFSLVGVLPRDIRQMLSQQLIHEHPTLIKPSYSILLGHAEPVVSSALTPDGKMALIGYSDGIARLWDLSSPASPNQLSIVAGHAGMINLVALTADGKVALTGSWVDSTMRLWDLSDPGSPKQLGMFSADAISSVALTGDGKVALTGSTDGTARLWDSE